MAGAYWAILPAAGVGRRMGSETPKQYLELSGRTVIEHAYAALGSHPSIEGVVVVVAPGDTRWKAIAKRLVCPALVAVGGAERCDSVLAGLCALSGVAAPDDWVLVHDAARPCLTQRDIDALLEAVDEDDAGGVLGIPVAETLKRVDGGVVCTTVDRDGLWRAATPQMFRLDALRWATEQAISAGVRPTDECQAIELAKRERGPIRMVAGEPSNLKITHPGDLEVAEYYLTRHARQSTPNPPEHAT